MGSTERGHTLVEMAVAAGLFAIVGSLLAAVTMSLTAMTRRGTAEVDSDRLARVALERMAEDLREAPGDVNTIGIWSVSERDPGTVYAFAFVSARREEAGRSFGADAGGSPRWQTAVYYIHDGAAMTVRRVARRFNGVLALPSAEGGYAVARGVRRLSVVRDGELIRIALNIVTGGREVTLETAVRPRN